jgi:ABC-2 type transport system ATP-binding protein
MELGGKERSVPGELSRGMRQKLALACGLLHDPAALIFDEPLTGLDPLGIRHIKQMIVARAAEGAAVVVSSHLLHLVEEICTRIVIIAGGLKVADGTLAELASDPRLTGAGLEEIFLRATGADAGTSDQP